MDCDPPPFLINLASIGVYLAFERGEGLGGLGVDNYTNRVNNLSLQMWDSLGSNINSAREGWE